MNDFPAESAQLKGLESANLRILDNPVRETYFSYMRRWALHAGFTSVTAWVILISSLATAQAQRGSVMVLSGSTNATSYEPIIIPSHRQPTLVPDQTPDAAGVANPGSGVVSGADENGAPILTAPADTSYNSITSAVPGVPIVVTNVPSSPETQEVLENSPYPLAPPPFVTPPPPFGGTGAGIVPTPPTPTSPPTTTTGTTATSPFGFSPGVATPPPPLTGIPPALPAGQPGLSSGAGIAGPPPGPPPSFTRAPGSRF